MGFYYLKQTNGYWAMYDPDDKPVYLTGINHLGDGSIYPFDMESKYGSKDKWAQSVKQDLINWGFNYLGPTIAGLYKSKEYVPPNKREEEIIITDEWPIEELKKIDYPFSIMLQYPGMHEMRSRSYPDVFSNEFRETLDKHCKDICLALKDNSNFIGYHFTHNPSWSFIDLGLAEDFTTWISKTVSVPNSPARKKWTEVMKRIYGTVERYKSIYYPIDDFSEIMELEYPLKGVGGCQHVRKDQITFIREFAKEWYKNYHDTIKRYDTNHLILGDRMTLHRQILPTYILDVMKPYVDVLSVVMMGTADQMMINMRDVLSYWDKPILVADVGARVFDGKIKSGYLCKDYEEFKQVYFDYINLGIQHPQILGIAWCGYWETTGTHSGVKDAVTNEDNEIMADIMKKANNWAQKALTEKIQKIEDA